MEKNRIGIISTILHSPAELKPLTQELLPGTEIVNIVDDSLVREVLEFGKVTPGICRRLCSYALEMELIGCKAVILNCSSLSEVIPAIQKHIAIPMMCIDLAMAKEAVETGTEIAIVGTATTTQIPTTRTIQEQADKAGKKVNISFVLAEGAYDALLKENNREKHDQILRKTINDCRSKCDVVCLAQGSMYSVAEEYRNTEGTPVLHTFRSGISQVKPYLE